jgi:cardiolipin synthase (CMP-forming)
VGALGGAVYTRAVANRDIVGGEPGALARDLRTWPNVVSLSRVALIWLTIALWHYGYRKPAVVLGWAAGLSDYLDGWLARRLKQSTRIGGLLDQAADVLFMIGAIAMFVLEGTWPFILLLVVTFREVMVLNMRVSAAEMSFSLPSIFLGKWSSNWMFWSMALMCLTRAGFLPAPYDLWIFWVAYVGMYVGVASSLVTASIYFRQFARGYRSTRIDAPAPAPAPADEHGLPSAS